MNHLDRKVPCFKLTAYATGLRLRSGGLHFLRCGSRRRCILPNEPGFGGVAPVRCVAAKRSHPAPLQSRLGLRAGGGGADGLGHFVDQHMFSAVGRRVLAEEVI
jgi:hypothetical protein